MWTNIFEKNLVATIKNNFKKKSGEGGGGMTMKMKIVNHR